MEAPHRKRKPAMWILVLEALLALGLAGFIIWWTWPRR